MAVVAPKRIPDVLLYCERCERFIAHEDAHGCGLPPAERTHRNTLRREKYRQIWEQTHDWK